MKKTEKTVLIFSGAFILLEAILTVLVQTTGGALNTALSYAAVISACIFSLIFLEKNQDSLLLSLGLIFTVCADFFLVVRGGDQKLMAMIFFSATQICYFLRLYKRQTKNKALHVYSRLILISVILILTVIVLGDGTDALSLVSTFYFANLLMNIVVAFTQLRRSALFAVGLLLFSMCDVLVGLSVMDSSYIALSNIALLNWLANPPINLAWLFYVPSQTLVALSAVEDTLKPSLLKLKASLGVGCGKNKA